MSNPDIQLLSEAAFKYGPFFFSILFVIFLTRWAYKRYSVAIAQNPPLDQRDKDINRTWFLATFFFGIVLVVISIVWWWRFKPGVYFFRGEIENLHQEDEIASDLYYLKRESRAPLANEDSLGLLRNEHFIIIQGRPFRKGQAFQLEFAKNHTRRTTLWITYDPDEDEPVYEIVYDEKKGSILKQVAPSSPQSTGISWNWNFEKTALASELPQQRATEQDSLPEAGSDPKLIRVLQDPRSDVAAKLDAIDALDRHNAETLKKDLQLPGDEPLALTFFDLTQHSDPELASKAKMLATRLDIDTYLVGELSSESEQRRRSAEKILLRISQRHAEAILKHVNVRGHDDLERTSQDVASGTKTQVLKPTASLEGDRYYVKATWDASDQRTVACLTQLFNSELINTRSLNQEQALMRGRTQRFVFWYSKDWAMEISGKIKKCGGSAEFVLAY